MAENYNGIPNKYKDIDVDSTVKKVDLSNLGGADVTGRSIWLRALDDEISFLRGDHTGTLTAGAGYTLASGEQTDPFYVDPAGEVELTVIATTGDNKTLRLFYLDG